jgi:hypothetical protein
MTRDLSLVPLSKVRMAPRRGDWGPWRLAPRERVLYADGPYPGQGGRSYWYEVDLDECITSAQVLDRIIQVAEKTWADNVVIAGLVRALDDVLRPQAHLCSSGASKTLDRAKIRALVGQAAMVEKGIRR